MTQSGWRFFVKTAVDRAAGLVGLVVAAPVLVGAAVAVKATMGSPVLFRQRRPGRGERVFDIVKFRTMREATDERGNPLSDAERLTPVGRWLRATSVDELPQLWNVVRGELSLVGPRPLLVRYLPRYSPEQRRRHEVMPGITGWAQIHGRNAISWEEKFALDVWYVEHWSLALDARILIETVGRVLKRDGVSSDGHATMPEFEGTPAGT
jgi:lipopolysaccharide/colanic/teichoic acid biosynthesis glycosyltransferase